MATKTDVDLTLEERATNNETFRHIERVRNLLNLVVVELLRRGELHDQSKLRPPEVAAFAAKTADLSGVTYGTPEYDAQKKALGDALTHHYANNRHHPEHHKNGIDDMNLIDMIEMLCDWKGGSERHHDGNILKSIEVNASRFHMAPQLVRIFENTAKLFDR